MSYLLDTNVISEVRKGAKCSRHVSAWARTVPSDQLFLSVLVLGEIRKGIERCRSADAAKAQAIDTWLANLVTAFDGRILPVDRAVAEAWGRLSAARSLPVIDSLIAATALAGGLTLVSRNVVHFQGMQVAVLNPFDPRP